MLTDVETFDVRNRAAIGAVRRGARMRALQIGFAEVAAEEIALVATELASNLVKHAGEGVIRIGRLAESERGGIGIESHDFGPGMVDVEQAFTDGMSSAGSLGYGLGTVHRMMDEVEITSVPELEAGTRIVCTRELPRDVRSPQSFPVSFGVAARAHPGAAVSGDAYLIKRWGDVVLVAVIDGLGHGQFALRASRTARDYVERHYDGSLENIFAGTNRACRGTRGVVMALARIDLAGNTLRFASIGNIEARLQSGGERPGMLVRRGVVGLNPPLPRVKSHDWGSDSLLVLHSDGLSTQWSWDDFPGVTGLPANEVARQLFGRLVKRDDDAVVVVVKGSSE